MSYLVLDGLTKQYGSIMAVDDLHLEIKKGEFVSLLGPSGCGKTTTLQMIAGFVDPTKGSIVLDGKDLLRIPANKRGLGIVFQNYALFPHMTAAQNVAFGLEMLKVSKDELSSRVEETLSLVGLSHLADRFPARMSGGQQQRVALARALAIRPSILLLDEPLSNLDAKLREEMQLELRSIQRLVGTTTILVTHDQSEAMALSDRVVVMNQGRIEQIAEPYIAYEKPETEFVGGFLGKANSFIMGVSNEGGNVFGQIGEKKFPLRDIKLSAGKVIIRPEKISFCLQESAILSGKMKSRVFQGNHWLCQVETTLGGVTIIQQNDGKEIAPEGSQVHLNWKPEDMRSLNA
jgi:putative spermidine/putrescine transport system ATP-binding protein